MSTVAFIQARMGATRLPGKVLMDLAGKPVLQHVVERVQASKLIDEVIVVTTLCERDIQIVEWCSARKIRVFCGSEQDVLDRFYQAAKLLPFDTIVRITADCPLMDPDVIDLVLTEFDQRKVDYVNNTGNGTWPDGLDVEVFRFSALEIAWKHGQLPSEREHVTPYIYNNPDKFSIGIIDHTPSLNGMRWTLDQKEDYEFISHVYSDLATQKGIFSMEQVLTLLKQKPELQRINNTIVRNEGYLNSLIADTAIKQDIQ